MQIVRINIKNFRNLNGVEVSLHPYINFVVGENDIGKSNFLDMLDIIFNSRRFKKDDFFDEGKPIEIVISLKLNNVEKGNFEDFFYPP